MQRDLSFVGTGVFYLAGPDGAFVDAGNVSAAQLSPQEETRELQDFRQPGGGLRNSLSRVTGVNFELTLRDFTLANLARALRATGQEVAAGSLLDEPLTAYPGTRLIPVPFTDLTADVLTDSAGTTTYTGYTVTGAGLLVTAGGDLETAIDAAGATGLALLLDADYGAQAVVQALTAPGAEYTVIFDGLDEAQSGEPFVVTMHRVKFSVTSALSLITEDGFGELALSGRLLADSSQGVGLSAYAEIRRRSAA